MNVRRMSMMLLLGLTAATRTRAGEMHQRENGLLVIVKDGRYGFIDETGRIVIPPMFLWGEDSGDDYAAVYVCGRSVWIDRSGRILAHAPGSEDELWPKQQGKKFGFADPDGRFRIPAAYDEAGTFHEGLAPVRVGALWGFINESGQMVIAPKFQEAFFFADGVGIVETEKGSALIDSSGKVLAEGYEFTSGVPAEKRVPAARGEKQGYLDSNGKEAIAFDYDAVTTFGDGLAAVKKNGKWGYIDREGSVRIPFEFDMAGTFGRGLAPARRGTESGFIDAKGGFVFSLDFQDAPGFLWGDVSRFWTAHGKFGYVTTTGKVIWGPTGETPDHWPLLGWSEQAKAESCNGIPAEMRVAAEKLPAD